MPRRDDDIFKKLRKETPLVKTSADSSPVDPDKKNTFDLMLERKAGRSRPSVSGGPKRTSKASVAKKARAPKLEELDVFSPGSKDSVKSKEAVYDIDYEAPAKKAPVEEPVLGAKRPEPKRRQQVKRQPEQRREELEIDAPVDTKRVLQKTQRADRKAEILRQRAAQQERELDIISDRAQRALSTDSGQQRQETPTKDKRAQKQRRQPAQQGLELGSIGAEAKSAVPEKPIEKAAEHETKSHRAEKKADILRHRVEELELGGTDTQTKPSPVREPQSEKRQLEFEEPSRQARQVQPVTAPKPAARPAMRRTPSFAGYTEHAEEVKKTFRHEIKYYINYKDHLLLRTALSAVMQPDDNTDESGGYQIRSLYFDDIYETALSEKIAGNDDRYKYRIRIYNLDDGVIKLEKKSKHGKFISKTSINITRPEYESIIAGDGSFLLEKDNAVAKEFYMRMKMRMLRPRVIVDYWREAFVHPVEDARVTFDIDLKGSTMLTDIFDPNTPVLPVYDNGLMVLEVKFNRYLPESIKCALGSLGAEKRSAISKYVLCRKYY